MKHLHLIALFMAVLIVTLPVCFAAELSIRYDANGNVIYDGQFYREYNGLNQLYRIWNGSNTSSPIYQEYTYHPLEERVIEKKTFNSNGTLKERVIYWDPDYVTIINSSGTYNYEYIHAEGQLMAQINPDGSIYYMETDIKGDVVAVMNSTGAVIENTSYSPYGEVLTGGKATRFGYEAQEHDSVLGDTDFHARKYKAEWGIFLQPDNLIPNVYNPQSLNRYSFEYNNPYNKEDPNGHNALLVYAFVAGFAVGTLGYAFDHVGEGRGGLSNFANYMGAGLLHGIVSGAVVTAGVAFISYGGGAVAAPIGLSLAFGGTLAAFEYVCGKIIDKKEINPSDLIITGGGGALQIPFGPTSGTKISTTNLLTKNVIKLAISYGLDVGKSEFVRDYLLNNPDATIMDNTYNNKPGMQYSQSGESLYDYYSEDGRRYPTNIPGWKPKDTNPPVCISGCTKK